MILRKPYAILIKNFKLIHVLLTAIMLYILYKTWNLMGFFSEYFSGGESIVGQDLASGLIPTRLYFLSGVIIVGLIIVLVLMYLKKKPITYYLYSITTYIAITVIFVITKNIILTMEGQLVSARIARAMSDTVNISFILQVLSTILTFIRATGFDIKKFNFVKDLQELDIDVSDNEEFEVEVNVDTDRFTRNFKRRLRYMKYVYVENKLIIRIIALISIVILGIFLYFKLGFADKKYNQGQYFYTYDFLLKVNKVYITNTDYKAKTLERYKNLVVVEMNARRLYDETSKLEMAKLELTIGDKHYYPNKTYKKQLQDFGTLYQGEAIPKDKDATYLIAYEVPTNYLDKKMTLKYINGFSSKNKKMQAAYLNVKLSPINLKEKKATKEIKLGDTMEMKETILKESTFNLNSYEIAPEFKLNYNYCLSKEECYPSFEYVKADVLNNYSKTLLKLNGTLKLSDQIQMKGVGSLYDFIHTFGQIEYELNGEKKTHSLELRQVKPKSADAKENTYIEVRSEIKDATKISLVFKIRNQKYVYELK